MKIVLYGIQTINKGAELMLYAILKELEQKYPDAVVYIPKARLQQGPGYMHTEIKVKYWPNEELIRIFHLKKILKLLHLPCKIVQDLQFVKNADYFIDASGFRFSDQFNMSDESVRWWDYLLQTYYQKKCKIIFLPQAFGPVEQVNTRKVFRSLSDYASVIMPREMTSFNYLKSSGVVDMDKVKVFTDFTSLVDGVFPSQYRRVRDGICIIPNMKMIDSGKISFDRYVDYLSMIIETGEKSGHPVYLLNHEGKKDEELAYLCKNRTGGRVEVITGLNALDVKGVISSAYLVVTSRFHGLASALNSCVPCLSTSWSHKYEELYRDYALDSYVLPLDNKEESLKMIMKVLEDSENTRIREHLRLQVPKVKEQTKQMWDIVWRVQ